MDFSKWMIPQLKQLLKKKGINTSLYNKDVLMRLASLASEMDLPDVFSEEDDNEQVHQKKQAMDSVSYWNKNMKGLPDLQLADVFVYLLKHCCWSENRLKKFKVIKIK